jgi:hypothetical protein
VGGLNALEDLDGLPVDTRQIKINTDTVIDKLWMVTRYVLD